MCRFLSKKNQMGLYWHHFACTKRISVLLTNLEALALASVASSILQWLASVSCRGLWIRTLYLAECVFVNTYTVCNTLSFSLGCQSTCMPTTISHLWTKKNVPVSSLFSVSRFLAWVWRVSIFLWSSLSSPLPTAWSGKALWTSKVLGRLCLWIAFLHHSASATRFVSSK